MAMDPDRTPVAQDVFTLCTKEKIETWHVVMHHNEQGVVDKVQCKSCGSAHKYKIQSASNAKQGAKRKIILSKKKDGKSVSDHANSAADRESAVLAGSDSNTLEEIWLEGIKEWGDQPIKSFDPKSGFDQGDVLKHDFFGKGVVQNRRDNKIDVLFEKGLKTLPSKRPQI